MTVIIEGDRQGILEDAHGVREVDAMLFTVGPGFIGIPPVLHLPQCMYDCALCQPVSIKG